MKQLFYAPLNYLHAFNRWADRRWAFPQIISMTEEALSDMKRDMIRGTASQSILCYMEQSPHWTKHYSDSQLRNEAIKTVMDRLDPAED